MNDNYSVMDSKDATKWLKSDVSSSVHFEKPGRLTYKEVMAQQVLSIADTDAVANELTNRMVSIDEHIKTGLEGISTSMLVDELQTRAQYMSLILVQASKLMTVGESLLSLGNLFQVSSGSLDGYQAWSDDEIDSEI